MTRTQLQTFEYTNFHLQRYHFCPFRALGVCQRALHFCKRAPCLSNTPLNIRKKSPLSPQKSPLSPPKRPLSQQKSPEFPQKSPISPQKSCACPQKRRVSRLTRAIRHTLLALNYRYSSPRLLRHKGIRVFLTEPHIPATEPHTSPKEPCLSTKEALICTKESDSLCRT